MENLFRIVDFELPNSHDKPTQMSVMQRIWFEAAQKKFVDQLGQMREGVNLVSDVYRLWDKLNASFVKDNPIVCQPGCGYCCLQLVCCTTLEMSVIERFINSQVRVERRKIIAKARRKAEEFYFKHQAVISKNKRMEDIGNYLKQAHYGKKCLYLNERDRCGIYPARPPECRFARSYTRCGLGPSQNGSIFILTWWLLKCCWTKKEKLTVLFRLFRSSLGQSARNSAIFSANDSEYIRHSFGGKNEKEKRRRPPEWNKRSNADRYFGRS